MGFAGMTASRRQPGTYIRGDLNTHVSLDVVPINPLMPEAHNPQPQWVEVAQRLRHVRHACQIFLDRWTIARLVADAAAVHRVADDLGGKTEADIADPQNRDWSILYRGSVLDD
jgi:hypothetical protein